jgi:hypothetical protein
VDGFWPDLIQMFKKEPELELWVRYGRTILYPVHDGRGHLDWIPEIGSSDSLHTIGRLFRIS